MANESNRNISLRQRTHNGVDKVMDKAESMQHDGEEELDNLRERAVIIRKNVNGYIGENPERSVLIAAGVGAIVGIVLTATIMRKR